MLAVAILFFALTAAPAHTQTASAAAAVSPNDLINGVNAYRASAGLEPYAIDGGLMALAQSHSDYQASIETCTHLRADGSGPGDYGISAENIACGQSLSVEGAIYNQWADSLHLSTMLGPTTGLVGAGMAVSNGTIYYTLTVKRGSGSFSYTPPQNTEGDSTAQNQSDGQAVSGNANFSAAQQAATNTPNADGSISHIVQYGETLVGIAELYGIPLSELIGINNLDPNNPVIYERQAILIRLAFTPTPFITTTFTPRPPTRTPMPSRTPRPTRTATVFHTPLPTATTTAEPLIQVPSLDTLGPMRNVMAYAFIGISVVGLLVLLFTSFLPGRKN